MKTLRVKEVFPTIQGEGALAGSTALFVRFAGCNLWSGHEGDRDRDARRNDVECPRFCDTDFVGGEAMSPAELKAEIGKHLDLGFALVVFTGGEPMLQLRKSNLLSLLREEWGSDRLQLMVETNGTVEIPDDAREHLDWICVSPKAPVERLKVTKADEVKVVMPSYDPLDFDPVEHPHLEFDVLSVQPEAPTRGIVSQDNLNRAIQFCLDHPHWRISLQQHKYMRIP